ncbi:fumarylacetoacetate hydrolase [Sphingomonas panacis]|uniref:Fumarylacetoacetate hydrolase n=1 Tax=Sphingomonas panacis TaxID=1560345 RepID=A0A1B3ZA53_9SPHN|nr:fumarylacetoacetate hydrolase family protein [Sphingomonas panacis]AOH84298.1 fumarylacetoacetate hydrolase [Sphingomonas panacis]
MKLATRKNGRPDGELLVVSQNLARAVSGADIVPTMREAVENWQQAAPKLRARSDALRAGTQVGAFDLDAADLLAPLPRPAQWLDASAFPNHGRLMAKAFGLDDVAPADWPLMYQGLSDYTFAPRGPVPFSSEGDGIDFEGEFAVVVEQVPQGTPAKAALERVCLVLLANDWSLRRFGPIEMRAGFGFIRAKPATAFAPVAVTPDELGDRWCDGRVALDLHVHRNAQLVGKPNGREMGFSFGELIAHAAYNRMLSAGSVVGSGTVSNDGYREVGSSCIAEQRSIETIDSGQPTTEFLKFGEQVRMEAFLADGMSVFGAIDQTVCSTEKM